MPTIASPEDEDWPVLARLHAEGLPHGFFPLLGPRFLAAYLRSYGDGPFGVARVARLDGEAVGFVVGSTLARAHSRWVVRHLGLRLSVLAAVTMLTRPRALRVFLGSRIRRYVRGVWRRLVPSRFRGRRGAARRRPRTAQDAAVLRHVVVDPAVQGRGVGGALVESFTDELRRRGTTRARLITRADEDGAAGLYERLGWRCARRRHDAEGALVLEYVIDLS